MKEYSIQENVRQRLLAAADPDFGEFSRRLVPGIDGILGVRTPVLRSLAKELKRDGWEEYIRELSLLWREKGQGRDGAAHEEMVLWGLCIGGGCRDWEHARLLAEEFIPAINNWAVCDIFCGSLKPSSRHKDEVWEFLRPYLASSREYELRFGAVMLLSHFADEEHAGPALAALDAIRHEGYYVKMAVAWAVSVYFIKQPRQVMPYLQENHLDAWTYNKALQKIVESLRVDQETKALIRSMKRPLVPGK